MSLTSELDGPESLRVATRDVLVHAVRDRISVTAVLRCVQLERASTIVDDVTGINEGVHEVGGNVNFGASSGPSRVGGELLVVEERRDGGVSVVALLACERVKVEDTAVAAVQCNRIRTFTCNTSIDRTRYPASIWGVGSIGLATVAAMNMALAKTEMIWRCQVC